MSCKTIYLFDVDGTLTPPGQLISDEMKDFILRISSHVKIGIVSGGSISRIAQKMRCTVEEMKTLFDYVFSENGLVSFKRIPSGYIDIASHSIIDFLGEEYLQRIINFCLTYIASLALPVKRGYFIDLRKGLINVSPVGRGCSAQEREDFEDFDRRNGVRLQMVNKLKEEFKNQALAFSIGGQISVDIFPNGWDKTISLQHLTEDGFEDIYFFGDRTFEGGNDYEIFSHPLTKGYSVTSPNDTKAKLLRLLDI